jgi:transposase
MIAYSLDMRERVIAAVTEKGLSKSEVAKLFDISRATVYRYIELDEADELAPKVHPGHPRDLDEAACQKLLKQVQKHPDLSLEEHAEKFAKEHKVVLGITSMWNYFERLGIRRKKNAASPRAR